MSPFGLRERLAAFSNDALSLTCVRQVRAWMISDVHDLPEKFALYVTRGSEPGRHCRVIWQRNHDVGVEFLKTPPEHKAL